jgi:3-methylcrotonyl-CoA carboxylase alpha subunit
MTLHLDLVELQLRVACGEALPASLIRNKSVPADGHAIELRLYAEDPQAGFLPGSGTLHQLRLPVPSAHVRVDSGVVEGDTVTIFYDPMIAKLIAWDRTRDDALIRMREALMQCEVLGPKSNIEFLERLVRHPAVVEGRIDTGYLDRHLDQFLPADEHAADPTSLFAAAVAWLLHEETRVRDAAAASTDPYSPWARADAFRLGHPGRRIVVLDHTQIDAHGAAGSYALACGERSCQIESAILYDGILSARFDGIARRLRATVSENRVVVHTDAGRREFAHTPPFAFARTQDDTTDLIRAPMPGRIVVIKVESGQKVVAGQELLVMEAMKMEISLKAPQAATIASLHAQIGDFAEADAILVRFGDTT